MIKEHRPRSKIRRSKRSYRSKWFNQRNIIYKSGISIIIRLAIKFPFPGKSGWGLCKQETL